MTKAKWTLMVYLAGDNNLTDECAYSLTEMKRVDTADRINVVAQFDPRGRNVRTHRYVINRGGSAEEPRAGGAGTNGLVLEDIVAGLPEGTVKFDPDADGSHVDFAHDAGAPLPSGEVNSGDPKTLFDFISWSIEKFPAEHYMLVLAGHGGGTEEDFLLKDESPRASLTIPQLRRVFERVKNSELGVRIDVLGTDVCLMSMAEVCYELRGLVGYMVGSEGYSATAGWPYREILTRLNDELIKKEKAKTEGKQGKRPEGENVCPLALAEIVADEYVNYYAPYVISGLSADQTVLDVDASAELARSVKELTALLCEELRRAEEEKGKGRPSDFLDQIVLAHWEAQSYNGERFADLHDFCDLLARRYAPRQRASRQPDDAREKKKDGAREKIEKACARVKTVIAERVAKRCCYTGIDYQYSYGVSVYFPWAAVGEHYQRLDFARDDVSGWHQFLALYTRATRRKPRGWRPSPRGESENAKGTDGPVLITTGGNNGAELTLDRFRTGGYRGSELNPVYSMRNPPDGLDKRGACPHVRDARTIADLVSPHG